MGQAAGAEPSVSGCLLLPSELPPWSHLRQHMFPRVVSGQGPTQVSSVSDSGSPEVAIRL